MATTYLNVYIKPNEDVTTSQIEKKIDLAIDWFRYDKSCYVLYTSSLPDKWFKRLEEFVKPDGKLFICELEINNRQGWMTKEFWNWLNKRSDNK